MKIALEFLKERSENLLQYNPSHSYLGQTCSVESKVFLVHFSVDIGTFSVHQVPEMFNDTLIPNIIVAHLVKVGQPSKCSPVRIYFGSLVHLEPATKKDIKAAIRKENQNFDSNELKLNLPYLELVVPYDNDVLDLVRGILMHKISALEGVDDLSTLEVKRKECLRKFNSLLRFFQSQWFPTNKTHVASWTAVPSVRSSYNICGVDHGKHAILWTTFLENIIHTSYPRDDMIHPMTGNINRLDTFVKLVTKEPSVENMPCFNQGGIDREAGGVPINSSKMMWKDILLSHSGHWRTLREFYG